MPKKQEHYREEEHSASSENEDHKDVLLKRLQEYGESFMSGFSLSPPRQTEENSLTTDEDTGQEDWSGIEPPMASTSTPMASDSSELYRKYKRSLSLRLAKKAFMSSKVQVSYESNKQSTQNISLSNKLDSRDDRPEVQNDALLYKLIQSKLFTNYQDRGFGQGHRELAGRIDEVAGNSKLGRGELRLRQTEHRQASKHVRDGLQKKREMRVAAELKESKQLGNYHPTLKKLYKDPEVHPHRLKRTRGLGMGVGKFSGGVLKLRREEIDRIQMQKSVKHIRRSK